LSCRTIIALMFCTSAAAIALDERLGPVKFEPEEDDKDFDGLELPLSGLPSDCLGL
jgi:hypothetical protein